MVRKRGHKALTGAGKLITLFLALWVLELDAQIMPNTGVDSTRVELYFSGNRMIFTAEVGKLKMEPFGEEHLRLGIQGFYPCGKTGQPELLSHSMMLQSGPLPPASIEYEVLDSLLIDLDELARGREIRPVPEKETKAVVQAVSNGGQDPGDENHRGEAQEPEDGWFGGPVLRMEYEGQMRGVRMSILHFSPFRYNPGTNQLVIYTRVEAWADLAGEGAGHGAGYGSKSIPFDRILDRIRSPQHSHREKALEVDRPIGLLVLSDTLFRDGLQPLIRWKRKKGFRVEEIYRQDLSDPSVMGIQAYLDSLYWNPPEGEDPPSYLMIVGDVEHIPHAGTGGRITDLYYTTFDGEGDYLPELFCGRISVHDTLQLSAVTGKILEYESCAFSDPSFLRRSVLIAGVDYHYAKLYGNGQLSYLHRNYLRGEDGREDHVFYFPGSDTARGAILDLLSGGVGFVNYTGHGEYDRWKDPAFTLADIGILQNGNAYPLMVGNGCETNVFTRDECFAEALLRAPGAGAIGYIGCTDDSYWEEDYYWSVGLGEVVPDPGYEGTSPGCFDRVFHRNGEDYSGWAPSLGEMVFWGNMAVQESSSPRKTMYWEIYQVAGDPTLQPWFDIPGEMHPLYPGLLPPGSTHLDLSCDPYAYVALSVEGRLLDARHASGEGLLRLDLPALPEGTQIDLVITRQEKQPFEGRVEIGEMSSAHPEILSHGFTGSAGDRYIHPGDFCLMDLLVVNLGKEGGVADTLVLRAMHSGIGVLDSICPFIIPDPGDSLRIEEVFQFRVDRGFRDRELFWLEVDFRSGRSPVYVEAGVQGPALHSGGILWEDHSLGNGDGRAEAGEWISCSWDLYNKGSYHMDSLALGTGLMNGDLFDNLRTGSPFLLAAGDSSTLEFELLLAPDGGGYASSGPLTAGWGGGQARDSFALWPGGYLLDCSRLPGKDFPFRSGGSLPWQMSSDHSVSSPSSYRSGSIGHSQESILRLHCNFREAGRIQFMYRVSSEEDYDFLEFAVDGEPRGAWSGEWEWTPSSMELDSGIHSLQWTYRKDGNTDRGWDRAWVDDIRLPEGTFSYGDLGAEAILNPSRAPRLPGGEAYHISLRNNSGDTISGFMLAFYQDGSEIAREAFDRILNPGETIKLQGRTAFDMEAAGVVRTGAAILSDSLSYQGNNRVEAVIERYAYPDLCILSSHLHTGNGVVPNLSFFLHNSGNMFAGSTDWEYYLDDVLREIGTQDLQLEPGELDSLVINLMAPGESLVPGEHSYELRILAADSLPANNSIRESFMWTTAANAGHGEEKWEIYPNPAGERASIRLGEPAAREEVFHLYTSQGKLCGILLMPAGSQSLEFSTSLCPSGSLIIRRISNGSSCSLVLDH